MTGPGRPAVAAAAALGAVLLCSACTSSGGAAPSSTGSAVAPTVTSGPATSSAPASPTSVALPSPTSTATESHLTRPAGARRLPSTVCLDPVIKLAGIAQSMRIVFAGYDQGLPAIAMYNFRSTPRVEASDRAALPTLRKAWLRAGYPASFPTVRDIDAMLSAANRLFAAARKGDIAPLPQIYLDYNSALNQYDNDANFSLCPE